MSTSTNDSPQHGHRVETPTTPAVGDQLTVTADPAGPDGAVVVLRVVGEVDLGTVSALRRQLADHLAAAGRGMVLDFTAVSFLGGCGLGVLAEAADQARGSGKALSLVAADNRPVLRPLEVTGLDQLIVRAGDVADGVRLCSG